MDNRVRETGAIKNPTFFKIGLIIFIICLIWMMFDELLKIEKRRQYEQYIEPLERYQDSLLYEIEEKMDSLESKYTTYYAQKDGNS